MRRAKPVVPRGAEQFHIGQPVQRAVPEGRVVDALKPASSTSISDSSISSKSTRQVALTTVGPSTRPTSLPTTRNRATSRGASLSRSMPPINSRKKRARQISATISSPVWPTAWALRSQRRT
jgi:hypothetical protein